MTLSEQRLALKQRAEQDLEVFIRLVHPQRVLGSIHQDLIRWWQRADASSHQLVLLPRDHGKSAMIAYRVAQLIIRNPTIRILYISATSNLAEKQLGFIKQILDSPIVRLYWPELLNPEEGRREKWTASEISVDHPLRKAEAIRDPTVFTAGLTTVITGLHCDVCVLDDVIIQDNAYTPEGRDKVLNQYMLLSSIEGSDPQEWVVGTRYHPNDLYGSMIEMSFEVLDEETHEVLRSEPIYDVFERKVENVGDGTGEFLWPRQQRYDGKWFGFNAQILAVKRAKYKKNLIQFRAQYYNEPNDIDNPPIDRSRFQYYDPKYLYQKNGYWFFKDSKLNVFASIDFAFSLSKKADYTAICVVGVTSDFRYYILEIARFKTDKIDAYFDEIQRLYLKWSFRKLRAEVSVAQMVVVNTLRERMKSNGLALSIEDFRPNRHQGSKEERIQAALEPRYENQQIWHYVGGNCQTLEEELVLHNPAHDDIKDALASVIDMCVPPQRSSGNVISLRQKWDTHSHTRFGGIS